MTSSTPAEQKTATKSMAGINLQELLQDLFLVLTQKETEVVKRRFALAGEQAKQTLEKIGQHFNVTRERIRQIESIALSKLKRTVRTTRFNDINEMAKGILKTHGGIMLSSELVSAVLKRLPGSELIDGAVLRLSFAIDPEMSSEGSGQTYKPFWRLASVSADDVETIIDTAVKLLQKRHSCMKTSEVISSIQAMPAFSQTSPSNELILGCLSVDERLKEIVEGWGLTDWRFVRPRSIRDKVEIILRKVAHPMHFVEIANSIKEATFDHKNVTIQAVHNELIRYPQFVLVGRGLYALREWGYEPGTVADIIEAILKKKGPLSKKQIIEEVGKQRTVKLGTISLNLQKMPCFVRVGRAVYDFDASKK
jgi:ElaB/YqjD/DUF883 family membrane-anchored ribosome-binding protein